jgi:predicted dehydrogenase
MNTIKDRGEVLRFGIVGAGRIAESYLQAFAAARNAKLVAIADVVPEAAQRMAGRFGCKEFASHLELADSGLVDAVIVTTPPATHYTICLDFLNRKIPVLCEKPVTIDPERARLIRKRAGENRTAFTMASKFRYVDDVVRAHNIVSSGALGEIILFENTFMSYVSMAGRWNANPAVSGGGVLIDNGTHSVDIMRYFIGSLSSIHVVTGIQLQKLPVEDTVHVTARSKSGATGRMDLSWTINKQCDDYIALYGTKGTLRVGWKGSYYRQDGAPEWVQFGHGYNKVQAFRDQIENFSASVQGLERLLIDSTDAVASVDVVRAGYQALNEQSWIDIQETEELVASYAA